MIFGLSYAQLAEIILALIAGGLATGFLAGLLGVGGGGIIVPILFEVFGLVGVDDRVRMVICVATSLAIIIPTSISSVRSHYRRGAVDLNVLKALAPWVAAGVIAGVFVASHSPANVLKLFFVASAIFMASRLIFGAGRSLTGTAVLPGQPWDAMAGMFIGLISTLIGIGGGAYISAYMSLFGWPIHTAIGTAAGFGPVIALPATIGYIAAGWGSPLLPPLSLGFVSVIAAAILAPVSVLTAPIGVRVAHGLSRRTLELLFATFLAVVAARFVISLLAEHVYTTKTVVRLSIR